LRHIYAQIVDDTRGHTLVAAASVEKDLLPADARLSPKETAALVGQVLAKRALERGIKRVVFDRGGYLYHGRVKALADGARQGGLEF